MKKTIAQIVAIDVRYSEESYYDTHIIVSTPQWDINNQTCPTKVGHRHKDHNGPFSWLIPRTQTIVDNVTVGLFVSNSQWRNNQLLMFEWMNVPQ